MKFNYSYQARILMNNNNFNQEEFEKWYLDNLPVGSNNILSYLILKDKEEKQKEVKQDGDTK